MESNDDAESAELAEKLVMLEGSGKLRRRTCKEAREIAVEAMRDPAKYLEHKGVVSPLWFSDDFHDTDRNEWYANVSHAPFFFQCDV